MVPATTGIVALFVAAFFYGSQSIGSRLVGMEFGPFLSTAFRAAVIVLILMWFVRWQQIRPADWKWFGLRALGNVIATTFIFIAVNKMPVGAALFSFYAGLILSGGIFGVVFYREHITTVKLISLACTTVGLFLVYSAQSQMAFNWYVVIAVLGGVGGSVWTVFSRPITKSYSLVQLALVDGALMAVVAFGLACLLHEPIHAVPLDSHLWAVVYLGFTQVVTGQLVPYGFKSVDAQIGSTILLNDSVFGMILVYLIFHEATPPLVILGGVCIFCSSLIPALLERHHS